MGKKRREEKLSKRKTTPAARPTNWKEALRLFPRLFLRTFIVVFALGLLMALGASLGLSILNNIWVQMGVYLGGYFLFQRWILGSLRGGVQSGSVQSSGGQKK